jgi:hypothetical protein
MKLAKNLRRWMSRTPGRKNPPARMVRLPYRSRSALLSRGELAFYRVLLEVVGGRFGISIKPRLADVVWCPPRLFRTGIGGRVSQKHLDFVLYDLGTTAVVLAIELDDRSHDRDGRQARDQFVDEVLELCGVALLRVRAARGYDWRELQVRMQGVLRGRGARGRRDEREGK